MAATFQLLDYCLFVAVLFISALIGIYYLLKEKWMAKAATSDDILMGGREMHLFPVAMSLVASYMSAITVLGIPTEMYVFGTQYWLVALSGFMTYPVTCHVFLPFFHNLQLASAYQYLELRFNRATRYLASTIFSIEMVLYMAVVLYAPSLALNQVTGLSLWGSILSVGAVVTFYTSMGGLRAVVWTDTFQTTVVVGGLVGIIVVGCNHIGGLSKMWKLADAGGRINFWNFNPSPFIRCTFWGLTVGSFIGQLTIYGANQTMLQRYMSISDVKKSQLALYVSLPVTLVLVSLVCMAGLVIYGTFHDCDPYLDGKLISRDQLLPYYVMEALGNIPGIPGLFVACIFSAALSSISSCLNALSITTLEDLIKPSMENWNLKLTPTGEARLAKLLGLVGGVAVIACAFLSSILGTTVLQIMISVLGMAGGPLLGLFMMGMFLPCVNAKFCNHLDGEERELVALLCLSSWCLVIVAWLFLMMPQGALSGLIVSTVVIFWIVIGAYVYQAPLPELPFDTSGCEEEVTGIFNSYITNIIDLRNLSHTAEKYLQLAENDDWSGFKMIFTLSFLWYPTVALVIALTVGIFVSWCTGWTDDTKVNPQYVYPVAQNLLRCIPDSFIRCFNCSVWWTYNLRSNGSILSDDENGSDDEVFNKLRERKSGRQEKEKLLLKHRAKIDSFETQFAETDL